jgi:hypothetical protein
VNQGRISFDGSNFLYLEKYRNLSVILDAKGGKNK